MAAYLAPQQAQRIQLQQQLEKDLSESQADIYVLSARELTSGSQCSDMKENHNHKLRLHIKH